VGFMPTHTFKEESIMKAIEDYLVETTIGDIKDGRPIRMYYQGHGNAGKKKVYLMTNPIFSEPIDGEVECPCDIPNNRNFDAYYGAYPYGAPDNIPLQQ
jgi:hypothetical protein